MHSVLRNEIIFLITFVWPLSFLLSALLDPPDPQPGRRGTRVLRQLLAGPFATVRLLVPLLRAPIAAQPVARRGAPGRGLTGLTAALLVLVLLLLLTGVAILYHPGWTATYFQLMDGHIWLGYSGWALWFAFVHAHIARHFTASTAHLVVLGLIGLSAFTMSLNEVNVRIFGKVPLMFVGFHTTRVIQRRLEPISHQRAGKAGLALLYIVTVTFATGAYIAEPFNSRINNNMGLYALYVHGGVFLALVPFALALFRWHLGVRWKLHAPRLVRLAALAVFAVGFAASSVFIHVKWFGPDGGLHLWPPSDFAGLYERFPQLSPPHTELLTTNPGPRHPWTRSAFEPDYAASMNDSQVCANAGCHPSLVDQWKFSTHRFAARNRFFQAVVERLRESDRGGLIPLCQNCHDPVGAFAPAGDSPPPPEHWAESEGVTCKICHTVAAVDAERGNGAFALRREMPYPVKIGDPQFAERWASYIRADLRLHFKNYANAMLLESADFCTGCHRVTIPRELNGTGDVVISDRHEPWSRSEYARQNKRCMNCHMGEWTRDERGVWFPDHRLPGLNTSLDLLVELEGEETEGVRDFIAFTRDWIDGVGEVTAKGRSPGPILGLEVVTPEHLVQPGERVVLEVVTTNRRVGHDFPAGPEDLNQTWLQLEVVDADGTVLLSSGLLTEDLRVPEEAHRLGARLVDADGIPVRHHEIWKAAEVVGRRELAPGESVRDLYVLDLPVGARGPVTVRAQWNHRRANQDFVDWAFDSDGTTFPVVPVVSGEASFELVRATARTGDVAQPRDAS